MSCAQPPGADSVATTSVHLRKIKRPTKGGKVRYEWHLRWHGTDGKHYCKKLGDCATMTKREAEALRRKRQAEIDRREFPRDRPKTITLGEFADYHESMIRGDRKGSTLYEYRLSARFAAEALGANKPIQNVTSADVGRLKAKLKGSAATRAKHLSRLRAMFNHAKRWGIITGDNPFANQPMPRFTPRAMRIFTPEEIEAMLADAPTLWWRAFILIGVTAGPRKEEILNLMWRDLDFQGREIRITAKKAEKFKSPDGLEYETLEWSPKTYAMRTLPIPNRTVDALRQLKQQADGSRYVFVTLERLARINEKQTHGQRRSRAETCNNVLRDFRAIQKKAAKRLGVTDWATGSVHDLRRTYGTRMADVVPMHVLQRWMGHSDVSVTARFYLGQSDQHAEQARDALSSVALGGTVLTPLIGEPVLVK